MTPLAHLAQRPRYDTGVSYARHSPPRARACQAHRQAMLAVTLRARPAGAPSVKGPPRWANRAEQRAIAFEASSRSTWARFHARLRSHPRRCRPHDLPGAARELIRHDRLKAMGPDGRGVERND